MSDLQEHVVAEITFDKERCFLNCLYRSPGQNDDELETFFSDLNFLLNNINRFQPSCSTDALQNIQNGVLLTKNNKTGIALENITSTASCI